MSGRKSQVITLGIALSANTAVVLGKGVAAVLTGSPAMAAEALHSVVDVTNQVLMGVGLWHSNRANKPHLEYAWGMAAAVAMFLTGGVYSVYEGVRSLISPEPGSSLVVALGVLGLAFCVESVSFIRAVTELWRGKGDRGFWEWVRVTPDTTTKATFAEDSVDLGGILLAAAGIGLRWFTGNAVWDGLAGVLVGVTVGVMASRLWVHNRRLRRETLLAGWGWFREGAVVVA